MHNNSNSSSDLVVRNVLAELEMQHQLARIRARRWRKHRRGVDMSQPAMSRIRTGTTPPGWPTESLQVGNGVHHRHLHLAFK